MIQYALNEGLIWNCFGTDARRNARLKSDLDGISGQIVSIGISLVLDENKRIMRTV